MKPHLLTFWAVLALVVMLSGCSHTRTVTVPAAEPSVSAELPDTNRIPMLPPPEPIGQITNPETVIIYRDTATYSVDLSWLEVDRTSEDETVTVRTQRDSQTVERRFQLPAFGESLQLRADSQGLESGVYGTPKDQQEKAIVQGQRPWWKRAWTLFRLFMAFVGGGAFMYVAVKLIPGL
jgi:hypothetical protein